MISKDETPSVRPKKRIAKANEKSTS